MSSFEAERLINAIRLSCVESVGSESLNLPKQVRVLFELVMVIFVLVHSGDPLLVVVLAQGHLPVIHRPVLVVAHVNVTHGIAILVCNYVVFHGTSVIQRLFFLICHLSETISSLPISVILYLEGVVHDVLGHQTGAVQEESVLADRSL